MMVIHLQNTCKLDGELFAATLERIYSMGEQSAILIAGSLKEIGG
jgi:hypothetical protein